MKLFHCIIIIVLIEQATITITIVAILIKYDCMNVTELDIINNNCA